MGKLLTSFSILFVSLNITAAEVDQFSRKNEELIDASSIVNKKANQYIKKSIAKLNASNSQCDEKALYKELRLHFGNHIKGDFTKYVIENNEVPKRHIPINESIYRDWKSYNGFILGNPLYRKSGIALSDLVKVGDVIVGTDKFEHIFGRGFNYFTKHYLNQKTIEKTLRSGVNQEKLIYGGLFFETGVFSYADLSANFNGMRFWNHVLLKQDDILGSEYNQGPFIKCEKQEWVQNEKIDFRNYFDQSMDESINCSKFSLTNSVEKYTSEIKELNTCSLMNEEHLINFNNKYKEFTPWIINKKGNMKVSYKGEYGN